MTDLLIDISNNQGPAAANLLANPSVHGCYAKATEGLDFVDPDYPAFRQAAAKARKPFGAYHFLHPDLDGGRQAVYLLEHAAPRLGDLEPVIDSETLAGGNWPEAATTTLAALDTLKQHGYQPLLYASTSFLEQLCTAEPRLKQFRAWQAQYASLMQRIPGIRTVLWQFTDRQVVGKGRFHVDGDRLLARSLALLEIRGPVHQPAAKKKPARKKPAAVKPAKAKRPEPPAGEAKNEKPFNRPVK